MSDGEKLILVMLTEVYKALGIKGDIDPQVVYEAVCSSHTWMLRDRHPGIFHGEVDRPEDVREVAEILGMWDLVESSWAALPPDQRQRVSDEAPLRGHPPKFEGFDGNHDPHYGIAKAMVEKMDYFPFLKGRALNSHSQTSLPTYREMLRRYDLVMRSGRGGRGLLDVEELISVVKP